MAGVIRFWNATEYRAHVERRTRRTLYLLAAFAMLVLAWGAWCARTHEPELPSEQVGIYDEDGEKIDYYKRELGDPMA
jgi:hypothetical protein